MKYPNTITLFMEPLPSSRQPSAFVVSAVTHGVLMTAACLGVFRVPTIKVRYPNDRFTLRILKLENLQAQQRRDTAGSALYPDRQSLAQAAASQGGNPARAESAPAQAIQRLHALQTLVQPDLPQDLLLAKKIPIPQMFLWSAKDSNTQKVVLAPVMKPMAANVKPIIERPNDEQRLADVKLTSTPIVKETAVMLASTTSPIVVKAADRPQQVPQMTSSAADTPTPLRVLSVSDVHMTNGAVPLPRVNESARTLAVGPPMEGQAGDHSQAGKGKKSGVNGVAGNGAGAGAPGAGRPAGGANGARGAMGERAQGSDSGSGHAAGSVYDRVKLPRDGQFGVVVVGSSIAEQYPETSEIWSGRLASTVYVHVGLAKSWILQYSQPHSADGAANSSARIEAPWPYDIARPTFAPGDLDADAVMVHGFVNVDGKFETLSVVFPPKFAREKFVLDALNQWQFRPAMQNRQPTPVEVLLVIPDQLN